MHREWLAAAATVMSSIADTQQEAIETVATTCADVIGAGHRVYTFGSGHSRIACEEMFPRYGSYPGYVPLVELSVTNYTQVSGSNGLRQAMYLERQAGFAEVILSSHPLRAEDALIVFSVSGVNALPLEMVLGAKQRGLYTVAVTSLAHCRAAAAPTIADAADSVIDLCVPLGDALVRLPDGGPAVGPGSTLAYVTVVNMLKVRVAELLHQRHALPPVITHAALVGAAASDASIRAALDEHQRRAAGTVPR